MQIKDLFLAQLDREATITRRMLERVPEGNPDWKPHEKSMSLSYLSAEVCDAFNHWAHHRGQLSVYLRLNDVPLASIYGPTADEKGF